MLADVQPALLIAEQANADEAASQLDLPVLTPTALMDMAASHKPGGSVTSLRMIDEPSLASIFYTSGTTGAPKGVECPHEGFINLAKSYAAFYDFIPGTDASTLTSSLGYDGSISEMYSAWVAGCEVVMLSKAALRSGPLATQTMALLDYGPHGGDHGHYDKLGLSVWIGGAPLIREAGHNGYTDPWYRGWYQRTLAHSTVVRDGLDQDALDASADLLRFTRDAGTTLLEVRTDQAYPGSILQRLTTTTAHGRVVDMFEVTGSGTHTYDYVLHLEGTPSISLAMTSVADDLGYGGAYGFLSNMEEASTDQDFEITVQTDAGPSTVRVLGAPGTTVYFGEAIGFPSNRAHPVLILRRTTDATVFATVTTAGEGLPQGMSIAHMPNSREITIEEPEAGAPTTIVMQ